MNIKWWCLFGVHEYDIIKNVTLTDYSGARGSRWILKCKCCGRMKKKDLI